MVLLFANFHVLLSMNISFGDIRSFKTLITNSSHVSASLLGTNNRICVYVVGQKYVNPALLKQGLTIVLI
jgi:hypothetical protein